MPHICIHNARLFNTNPCVQWNTYLWCTSRISQTGHRWITAASKMWSWDSRRIWYSYLHCNQSTLHIELQLNILCCERQIYILNFIVYWLNKNLKIFIPFSHAYITCYTLIFFSKNIDLSSKHFFRSFSNLKYIVITMAYILIGV